MRGISYGPQKSQKASIEQIITQASKEMADAMMLCAIPQWFDAEVLDALGGDRLGAPAQSLVSKLGRFSFVTERPIGGYVYDESVRTILLNRWQREDKVGFLEAHRRALAFFEQRLDVARKQKKRVPSLVINELHKGRAYHASVVALEGDSDVLRLAYAAKDAVPTAKREQIAELVKAVLHVELPLTEVQKQCGRVADYLSEAAQRFDEGELLRFLSALSIFLKAESEVKTMRQLEAISENRLSTQELTGLAQEFAGQLYRQQRNINDNKLKRLGARIGASRDRYEALAHLAKFYPLAGIPQNIINDFVAKLGELELDSFKKLFAWSLTFYEAKKKGWRG